MDKITAIKSLESKFTSHNSVEVERGTITRKEFEAIKASQWISVADKLPENGVWVLISVFSEMAGRVVSSMAFYEVNDDGEAYWLSHNDNKDDEWEGVIAWMPMPLPEGPTE